MRGRDFLIFTSDLPDYSHLASEAPLFPPTPKTLLFPGLDKLHPFSLDDIIYIMFEMMLMNYKSTC